MNAIIYVIFKTFQKVDEKTKDQKAAKQPPENPLLSKVNDPLKN